MSTAFVGCGVTEVLIGRTAEVTGLEDEPDGALRIYVGPRYKGVYAIVEDQELQRALWAAWSCGGHVVIPRPPPECLMQSGGDCPEEQALQNRSVDESCQTNDRGVTGG